MPPHLYYIHDPMCSWCWGFRPVWRTIRRQLPQALSVRQVLGGLAPDSDEPMPRDMQHYLQKTWQTIQQRIPGTQFNFAFWTQCRPRRSTYPACRAVLAARAAGIEYETAMIEGIQQAYYLQARNPSDDPVLIAVAESIGLDGADFAARLNSPETHRQLAEEIALSQDLFSRSATSGFPSLVLQSGSRCVAVPRDYTRPQVALAFIDQWLEKG